MEPASIRYNNPGAMWGGSALARKWGATRTVGLNDGTGQGNTIAVFPTKVRGACAQFDLWRTSAHYKNKPLARAIHTWSGGNHVRSYLTFLQKRVPGLTDDTVMSSSYLNSPSGILFVKAQAWHEAGKPYPMSDAEWRQAQSIVFSGAAKDVPVGTNTAGAGGTAAAVAVSSGFSIPAALAIGVVIAIAIFVVSRAIANRRANALDSAIARAEAELARARAAEAIAKADTSAPVPTPSAGTPAEASAEAGSAPKGKEAPTLPEIKETPPEAPNAQETDSTKK